MRSLLTFFYTVTVLAFLTTTALAVPTTDSFSITLDLNNQFVTGDGSGYNDGTGMVDISGNVTPWYYYPNTSWYNQWFYDDPLDPTRWKEITYDIDITGVGDVTVVINWSTLAFPESGPDNDPPLPPLTLEEEQSWINRDIVIFDGYIESLAAPQKFTGTIIIPDYNPEWVSIDVMGSAEPGTPMTVGTYMAIPTTLTVSGIITHECIPAPGAIILGSIGVGFVGWLRRRRAL